MQKFSREWWASSDGQTLRNQRPNHKYLIDAFVNGATIELSMGNGVWKTFSSFGFAFHHAEYRIAKEAPAKRYWLARHSNTIGGGLDLFGEMPHPCRPANGRSHGWDGDRRIAINIKQNFLRSIGIDIKPESCVPLTVETSDSEVVVRFKLSETKTLEELSPKKKYREWTFADRRDIPDALTDDRGLSYYKVTSISTTGLTIATGGGSPLYISYADCLRNYKQFDTSRSPCGVEVTSEEF